MFDIGLVKRFSPSCLVIGSLETEFTGILPKTVFRLLNKSINSFACDEVTPSFFCTSCRKGPPKLSSAKGCFMPDSTSPLGPLPPIIPNPCVASWVSTLRAPIDSPDPFQNCENLGSARSPAFPAVFFSAPFFPGTIKLGTKPRATGIASSGIPFWDIMSLLNIADPELPPNLGTITSSVFATIVWLRPPPIGKLFKTLVLALGEAPPSPAIIASLSAATAPSMPLAKLGI